MIRGCEVQARPALAIRAGLHVRAVADVIDPSVGGQILDERLAGGPFHRPVDGPREQVHPVTGTLAGVGEAEGDIGLLAGEEQERVVREPPAFVEHRLHFGQPERTGVLGMAVAVELGQVDDLDAHGLEHPDEVGRRPRAALGLLLHRGHGRRHVPVARELVMAGEVGEPVAVGVSAASSTGPALRPDGV